MTDPAWTLSISLLVFAAVYLFVAHGWAASVSLLRRREVWFERTLNQHLLLNLRPRTATWLSAAAVLVTGLVLYGLAGGYMWFILGGIAGLFLPTLVIRHLEAKRAERLEEQLVDGIVTLASGARAGLNLVQSMELLVKNAAPPIRQEFAQLLREYQMGLDLNQAMRNAANRVGSSNYRLLFTAIEMHRLRGGNTAESLDRIAESIREIQRLEGKLDALTAQGRTQARMMAAMPVVILFILYSIAPEQVGLLFTEPIGRVLLLAVAAMIVAGFLWIRRILAVDI